MYSSLVIIIFCSSILRYVEDCIETLCPPKRKYQNKTNFFPYKSLASQYKSVYLKR